MASKNLNIRVDENLKKQSENLFNELGMPMSTAINIFLKSCVRFGGIPFEVKVEKPNAETMKAMNESKLISHDKSTKGYTDVDEMMKELLK